MIELDNSQIFESLNRILKGDKEVRKTLEQQCRFFRLWNEDGICLVLCTGENPDEQAGFCGFRSGGATSFLLPADFIVKQAELTSQPNGICFTNEEQRVSLSFQEMSWIWDVLPVDSDRRNGDMIKRLLRTGFPENLPPLDEPDLGVLTWESYIRGYQTTLVTPLGRIELWLKVLDHVQPLIDAAKDILTRLSEYDKLARDGETDPLSGLIVYDGGSFDLTYDLDEDEYADFVSVQFSADGTLLDIIIE